ncbi:hypothetical protein A4X09_0g5874 [Tilletia walkeri]|uniref:Uncharacterized protein n=1 Tax=Tilletia walkeri TaxID=117179 RepID=A0A8X7T2P1_9BASI|nr:hypothetical protein A4X09_0g5874 [Tilletia walkeri]
MSDLSPAPAQNELADLRRRIVAATSASLPAPPSANIRVTGVYNADPAQQSSLALANRISILEAGLMSAEAEVQHHKDRADSLSGRLAHAQTTDRQADTRLSNQLRKEMNDLEKKHSEQVAVYKSTIAGLQARIKNMEEGLEHAGRAAVPQITDRSVSAFTTASQSLLSLPRTRRTNSRDPFRD